MIELLLLSVALATDAAAANAGLATRAPWSAVLRAAVLFGVFQAGMAAIGWWGGAWMAGWASAWDHWVAFVLLGIVGVRAIHGAMYPDGELEDQWGSLLLVAVATSLDALAAGVSLPLSGHAAPVALAMIGGVTAGLSVAGGALGRTAGRAWGPPVQIAGGIVLIAMGVRVLVTHLQAGI